MARLSRHIRPIHLSIGGPKGDERNEGEGLFVKDGETYRAFYSTLEHLVGEHLDLTMDHQKFHNTTSSKHFLRKLSFSDDANHIVMRIEWKYLLWSQRRLLLARDIAESLCRAILGSPLPSVAPSSKPKPLATTATRKSDL